MSYNFEQSEMICVNGVFMSLKDYKKSQRKAKARKSKRTYTSITILPSHVKLLMRGAKVIRTLIAYQRNGYRQWGTIVNELLKHPDISCPWTNSVRLGKEVTELVDKVCDIAKKNDKDAFQYVKKLEWKLRDLSDSLDELTKGVRSSRVLEIFSGKECVDGCYKRVGLKTLTQRSGVAVTDILKICNNLFEIEKQGVDVTDYTLKGTIKRA